MRLLTELATPGGFAAAQATARAAEPAFTGMMLQRGE
jgi:hypothetical protein